MSPLRLAPVVLAVALAACTPPETSPGLMPSLSQVRYGTVDVDALDSSYVLPDDVFIPGVVENSEEQRGYERIARVLTPEQMENLARFEDNPTPLEKHADYTYDFATGDLLDDDSLSLDFDDVEQGAIGDCYLVAAISAVLYADHDARFREGIIRPVRDGAGDPVHYAVRFYDYAGRPQDVEIDATLVRSGSGNPTYARSLDSRPGSEEWGISLIEKAYAKWHGDFETIGDGGSPGDAMQALTGSHSTFRRIEYMSDASLYDTILKGTEEFRPMTALTFGEDDGVDYEGTNIYAWHAYTILGAGERETGERYVELRNPWGSVEPPGNGPDDGIFKLDLDEFRRLYMGVSLNGGMTADTVAPAAIDDLRRDWSDADSGSLAFTFTATGDDVRRGLAYRYDLRVSTAPITAENFYEAERVGIPDPQAPGTVETVVLSDVEPDTLLHLAIRVEDESGNVSPISNVATGELVTEEEATWVDRHVFDFETDHSAWMVWDGLFHVSTDDALFAGDSALWCADPATRDFDHGHVTCSLMVLDLDLANMGEPSLVWTDRFDGEVSDSHDRMWVEVQGADEAAWTKVWEKDGLNVGEIRRHEVDLAAWDGQSVSLMFHFDSVDDSSNTGLGWAIRDLAIRDLAPPQ